MSSDHRILLAVKGSVEPDAAVERARLIAERLKAEVVLVAASRHLSEQAEKHLQRAEQLLRQAEVKVRVHAHKLSDPLEELVQLARDENCGLLIKAPDRPRGLADLLLTPRDWKLLRYAPCPVLIVKQDRPWQGRRLLAAIDVAPGDSAHRALNEKILQLGDLIAELAEAHLDLICAYPAPMQGATPLQQSPEQLAAHYRQQAEQMCQQLQLQPADYVVDEGPAESLIPEQARLRQAGLVVLGTVARRGLSAALLGGNTAEAILAQLHCDVLTVQPEGDSEIQALLRAACEEGNKA